MRHKLIYWSAFFLILFGQTLLAHNGKLAYSKPISTIKIDGKLEDWPKSSEKYIVENFLGKQMNTNAHFQTAYNKSKNLLFIAVVVHDDNNIFSGPNTDIFKNNEDKLIIYLDPEHSKDKGSGVIALALSQSGISVKKAKREWDPYNAAFSKQLVDVQIRHKRGVTVYEIEIELENVMSENKSIGLDFLIVDNDGKNKPNSMLVWSPKGAKSSIPSRLGDLILVSSNTTFGEVQGNITYNIKTNVKLPKSLKIEHSSNSNFWSVIDVDTLGHYSSKLPIGDYHISPWQNVNNAFTFEDKYRIDRLSSISISVEENKPIKIDTLEIDLFDSPRFLIPKTGILYNEQINLSQIDNFVKIFSDYFNVSGGRLAVIKDGEIFYNKPFGLENTITQKPVNGSSIFEIASVSKTIFAFAINRLVKKGLLDWDEPLHKHLSFEQISEDENAKLITARHILSHQSGLPNWAWNGPFGSENGKNTKLLFKPGTKFQYSGEAYEYLKRVVEKITGKDIERIIQEEVFVPFGMKESAFTANRDIIERIVVGHIEMTPMFWKLHDRPWVAGSMYTTTNDMALFMKGLMDEKYLSKKAYDEMFKTQVENNEPWRHFFGGNKQFHSLGFEIEDTPHGRIIHHGGNNGDFQSRFAMNKKEKNGFILLTNNNNGFSLDLALQEFFFSGRLDKAD